VMQDPYEEQPFRPGEGDFPSWQGPDKMARYYAGYYRLIPAKQKN